MRLPLCALAAGALAMGACGGGNPLHETALGISAASSVGRSVELALAGMTGVQVASCVQVAQACTSYPCTGAATVNLGSDCTLPLGGAASGTVAVMGQLSSATDGTLTATFTNVTVGKDQKAFALASVTAITASQSGNTVQVTYAGENAQARSGAGAESIGAADSWTLDIDTKGTTDLADDVISIDASSASGAAGAGATAKAATLSQVVVDPSCALNPIGGSGNITEVSTFVPTIENISFHAACDGKGEINGHAYPFDVTP